MAAATTEASTSRPDEKPAPHAARASARNAGDAIASALPPTQGELRPTISSAPTPAVATYSSSPQAPRRQAHQAPASAAAITTAIST